MTKALVFVGAFNPPTVAHIEAADEARQYLGYEYVIFVPSKMTYIKNIQGKELAFDDEDRYGMLAEIAETHPWMLVSDYELSADHQPRTYETLKALREETGVQLTLLLGSDKLPEFETGWLNIMQIGQEFGFAIMRRNHDCVEELIQKDAYLQSVSQWIRVVPVSECYQTISSRHLRKLLRSGSKEEWMPYLPAELHDRFLKEDK